jgi:branched-chain amino acid transport system ATP-binding protein
MLDLIGISVCYGANKVLEDVSLTVNSGEIVSLIGPNGAGKSTALKAACGMLGAEGGAIVKGSIQFLGTRIDGLRTDQLVEKGLCLVPEGRRVFQTMSVMENLEMGGYTRASNQTLKTDIEDIFKMFPILQRRVAQKAGTLSSGEQQMLVIGRALMLKPKLLLADEPSLGLSPSLVDTIFETLLSIRARGTSILIVEQNARLALDICDRAYIFEQGRIVTEGKKQALLDDPHIKQVFLGGKLQ